MRARPQRGLGSEREGCLASWQYAPTAGYAPAVIEGRDNPLSGLRQPADPGPMLRRTFCHNVNRALGRVKLFCDTIPRKRTNTREWRHVRFVPKASQRTAQKVLLFDHLVSGDAQLIGHGEAEHPGGLVAGPDVAMQESDGGNPICSLLRLPVPILPARRVAATPPPFGPGMRQGPRWAASGRRRPTLSRKRSVVRRRNGHADQLLDVAQACRLFAVAERNRDACCPGPRGAADAMHVGFRHVRQIEIHDVADAVDVDAARSNVGGDQRKHLALAKCGKHPFALVLRLVAVDRVGRDAGLGEAAPTPVRALSFSNTALLHPHRLQVNTAYTEEMAAHSNIEAVVRQTLGEA